MMDLGISPKINYQQITFNDLDHYNFKNIAFDKIENTYFQSIKKLFSKYLFEVIAFHETTADLSDTVINVEHLVVGDKSKFNLSENSFKNLKEVTFLSMKTFKGKIFDKFQEVEKLVVWHENQKSNTILENFPNLKELHIYNGSIVELNLNENQKIEQLELYRCTKMEKIILPPITHLKKVIIKDCKKLDTSNLHEIRINNEK